MCGISGINGSCSCGSQKQQQQVVEIDGQQITLTGNPDQDAKNAASQLGISESEAKAKLQQVCGEPQKPQQQKNGGIGTFDIGNAMLGY